jgi:hypothetical protein
MRSRISQFGLPVGVLVAWLWLGAGNHAHAAFLVRPVGSSDAESGMATAATDSDSDAPERSSPKVPARLFAADPLWAVHGQSGAGCSGTSVAPTGAGSVLHATVFSHTDLSPLPVVRWLYFEGVDSRPPPFPSRLFRPPRSC